MSDDFRFDDDLFGDEDDDELFDDEQDDFGEFDEFEDTGDLDEEFDFGDEDIPLDEDEAPADERTGPSRAFLIIAAILILILLGGVALVATQLLNGGEDPLDVTRTAIANLNATVEQQLRETQAAQTQQANATATALAIPTATPTPSVTPSPTPDLDATATANAEATVAEQTRVAGAAALALTETAAALEAQATPETDEPPAVGTAPDVSAVQQTATALAELFEEEELGTEEPVAFPTTPPQQPDTTLPDTGLFDDIAAGGPGVLFLMAFGLLGVIVVSRRLRARDEDL